MANPAYSEKLKDPRWQRKRLEILQRDNWCCTKCGNKEATLHVHHFQYSGEPWEIDSSLLVTLCKHCHKIIEWYKDLTFIKIVKLTKRAYACFTSTDVVLVIFDEFDYIGTNLMISFEKMFLISGVCEKLKSNG